MKAIPFAEQNCVYAKDQPEYLPLPVHKTIDGDVISCYKLTYWERIKVLFGFKIWITVKTFNNPLQPQRLTVYRPF